MQSTAQAIREHPMTRHTAVSRALWRSFFTLGCACAASSGFSAGIDALTAKDASGGMRAALSQGIDAAVKQLGAHNGFLNDPRVMIPLPPALQKVDRVLRTFGMSADADALKAAMNHAAEAAVAEAKPVFKRALQSMTIADAKGILLGGDDAATQYFRRKTGAELAAKFRPIIARQTANLQLASLYDRYAGKAAQFGLVTAQQADLNDYVTAKALDGLFSRIADQERAIRKNPLGQASSLIKRVFGALH
jgi:hypothetical protein